MRSLDLKSLVAAKRPAGKGRKDICLVGSRSPHDRRSSRMASTALPYLGSEMRESASPELDASHCPSSLESPVGSGRRAPNIVLRADLIRYCLGHKGGSI